MKIEDCWKQLNSELQQRANGTKNKQNDKIFSSTSREYKWSAQTQPVDIRSGDP
jgi:hypothetical protein